MVGSNGRIQVRQDEAGVGQVERWRFLVVRAPDDAQVSGTTGERRNPSRTQDGGPDRGRIGHERRDRGIKATAFGQIDENDAMPLGREACPAIAMA